MKANSLKLSAQAVSKLSALALAVEINEKKRYSIRQNLSQVLELIKSAAASEHADVRERFREVKQSLSPESIEFFRQRGLDLDSTAATQIQRTYRGQAVSAPKPESPQAVTEPENSGNKKKKIVYRGKVMYV